MDPQQNKIVQYLDQRIFFFKIKEPQMILESFLKNLTFEKLKVAKFTLKKVQIIPSRA